jgi:hypothetical protein
MPLSSITAVRPTANTIVENVLYGATISAGQPLYLDSTDNEHKLADANASTTTAMARGIAVTPGVDAGYGFIARSGSIILVGTTMVVGEQYYVGPTAGQIIASSELTTGDRVTLLGVAASATQLDLNVKVTGITRA